MISEINPTEKTNTITYFICRIKKTEKQNKQKKTLPKKVEWWLLGAGGGRMGKGKKY